MTIRKKNFSLKRGDNLKIQKVSNNEKKVNPIMFGEVLAAKKQVIC
jgi:hypothetical protein